MTKKVGVYFSQAVAQTASKSSSEEPSGDIFFEVRSLIWPDRSQDSTMLDVPP
jgi:hypothetical protein